MKYLRVYADDEGVSHFQDVTVETTPTEFAPPAPPIGLASPADAERAIMMSLPPGWSGDWHPAPRRQFFVLSTGQLDVMASDGEQRRLDPGAIVLLEDTTGKGHVTKVHGEAGATGLFVQLPDTK